MSIVPDSIDTNLPSEQKTGSPGTEQPMDTRLRMPPVLLRRAARKDWRKGVRVVQRTTGANRVLRAPMFILLTARMDTARQESMRVACVLLSRVTETIDLWEIGSETNAAL